MHIVSQICGRPAQPVPAMRKAHGGQCAAPKRRKPMGDKVPMESWAKCLSDNVQECLDSDVAPFPIGSYAHIRSTQGACIQSVPGMLHLLKMMCTRAPGGIVNYAKLCSVLQCLLGKEVATPELNKQGCRPVGLRSCTGNQVCDGALQGHGAATRKI